MRRSIVRAAALGLASLFATTGSADPAPPRAVFGSLREIPPAVLVGSFGGGHGSGLYAPQGWFLGVETGWAWLLGLQDIAGSGVAARSTSELRDDALCFGARAGYQLATGLAVQARFDKLGVSAPDGSGPLMIASAGVRYSVPIMPMPFAEALIGPALHGGSASPAVGLGVGASLVVARHLTFDASVRDWLVDVNGVHHAPAVMIGITAGFGG